MTATAETEGVNRDPREEMLDHLPALRAFAMSLTRNLSAADDLVQDTIVKAWSNLDKFRWGTNLRAWLFTILRNTFYSERSQAEVRSCRSRWHPCRGLVRKARP